MSADASPQAPLGRLQRSPDSLAVFRGLWGRDGKGGSLSFDIKRKRKVVAYDNSTAVRNHVNITACGPSIFSTHCKEIVVRPTVYQLRDQIKARLLSYYTLQ